MGGAGKSQLVVDRDNQTRGNMLKTQLDNTNIGKTNDTRQSQQARRPQHDAHKNYIRNDAAHMTSNGLDEATLPEMENRRQSQVIPRKVQRRKAPSSAQ